jgi:hypothetical protein
LYRIRLRIPVFLLLSLCAAAVPAQSSYMEKDQYGLGTDAGLSLDGRGQLRSVVGAGYSVNGFVDLGAELAGALIPEAGSSVEYDAAMTWNFTLLKQDRVVPFTVSLPGAIRKMVVVDEGLSELGLIKTGTGYSLGIELFRYLPVSYRQYLRLGLTADLGSSMYLTEQISGTAAAGYPQVESLYEIYYGALLGLSLRPSKANRGVAISVDARAAVDTALHFRFGGAFSFTLIENKTERMDE